MQEVQKPRRGAAYIRVSTEDQIEYSPESQLAEIRRYAEANHIELQTDFIFVDEGISGKSIRRRDGFLRMIGTARRHPRPFDVLLLWKFSRFARNREDSILYKSMLRRQLGIEVVSVSEPIGDEGISIILEAMIEAMDEYYSINLAGEVRRGMTQRAREGKPNTCAPMGYRMQNGNYAVDPDTAPVVRKMYEDFLGGKPLVTIARELNAMGVRTRHGNPLQNRTIEYILRNPVYIGKVRWTPTGRARRIGEHTDTITADSSHTPLISPELYDRVQCLLVAQKLKYPPRARRDGQMFLLKGLLRCSCCGASLVISSTSKNTKGGPSVQCCRYTRGQCPESHSVRLETITTAVLKQIIQDFRPAIVHFTAPVRRLPAEEGDRQLITRRIACEQQKLARVRQAYEAGADTLEEYRARKESIEKQIAALQADTPEHALKPSDASPEKGISNAERNEILRSFIRCIVFDRKSNTFTIHYYT